MTKAGDTIPNTEAPSDSEPDTTPATPDALGDQLRGAMAAMMRLSPEARAALAQANVTHMMALKAWKDGAIDDPSYLKAANDYANVMLAIEANGVA